MVGVYRLLSLLLIMTTPVKQASFPPYTGMEESPPSEDDVACEYVNRIIRYGGDYSPFVSTGPEILGKAEALDLLRKAKEQLDLDYIKALNAVDTRYEG